jgi:hypothetical protein
VEKNVPKRVFKALAGERLFLLGLCSLDKIHPHAHGNETLRYI